MVTVVTDPRLVALDILIPKGPKADNLIAMIRDSYEGSIKIIRDMPDKKTTHLIDVQFRSIFEQSQFVKSMMEIEWDCPEKVHMIFRSRYKGGKKHVQKNRGETDQRSEGGNRKGADPAVGHGKADRVGGTHDSDRDPGFESYSWSPEGAGTDNDCD